MIRSLLLGLFGLLLSLGIQAPNAHAAAPPPIANLSVSDALSGGAVRVDWSGYVDSSVSAFALYVSSAPLSSVAGLTPWRIYPAGTTSASVIGLVDGQPFYLAVVAVGNDGQFVETVLGVAVTPTRQGTYGTVMDFVRNFPLNHMQVQVPGYPPVVTGPDGRYALTGLPAGNYTISAGEVGGDVRFNTRSYTITVGAGRMLKRDIYVFSKAHNLDCGVPDNFTATPGDGKVRLCWDALTAADLAGYIVYRDGVALHSTAAPWTDTCYIDGSVNNGSNYDYMVYSYSRGNILSDPSPTVTVTPQATTAPPIDLAASLGCDGRVTLSWLRPVSSDLLGYAIYQHAGAEMDYASAARFTVDGADTTRWISAPLAAGSYTFALRSVGSGGEEQNIHVVASLAVPAAWNTPQALVTIPRTGKRVSGNALHVQAQAAAPGCGTLAADSVRFQYRPSGTADWLDIPAALAQHPNPDVDAPYFTKWDVTGLPEGGYDLRAIATAGDAIDPAPGSISVTVDHHQPEIVENRSGNARFLAESLVESGRVNVADGAAVTVGFAPATLALDTRLRLALPTPEEFSSDSSLLGGPVGLSLASGQSTFPTGSEVTVGLPYADGDGDGAIDGLGYFAADTQVAVYNPTSSSWEVLPGGALDAERQQVTGQTAHFSYFQLRLKDGLAPAELPANPQGPTLSTSGSFRLAWEPATGDGVLYELQSATSSDFSQGAATCYVGPLTSAHVTAAATGSGYFRVRTLQPGHAPSPWTEVVAVPVTLNYGDVNLDGQVDAVDALLALQMAVGRAQHDLNADLGPLGNGVPAPDGTITAGDALLILRKAVGLW